MKRETIVCVTPNAALDRTLVVPDFAIGHISRIPNAIAVPGGKGLNVLRAVRILGGKPLAMGLLGGYTGRDRRGHWWLRTVIRPSGRSSLARRAPAP